MMNYEKTWELNNMPISNSVLQVEAKSDKELLLKTPSVQNGNYVEYTTKSEAAGSVNYVVYQNPGANGNGVTNTTQIAPKEEFDSMVSEIKQTTTNDQSATINFTELGDIPKNHPLSGITPFENAAAQSLAEAAPNKKVDFATLDKVINVPTESFKNVTGLFQDGLDKFKLSTIPSLSSIASNKLGGDILKSFDIIKDAKNLVGNIFGSKIPSPSPFFGVDIITANQKDAIQKNATKISKTEEYMVKLEQWNQNSNEKLTTWNPDLGLLSSIVFTVMPIVDENRSASYDSLTPTQHPGSIQVYKTTSSRTFNINGKFISRSIDEANRTLKYLNTIRAWVMPYYGSGTAESYPNKIGLPPEILRFNAYGDKNLKDIPVVLTNYSWTYPEDVDYVQAIDSDNKSYPVPRIIEISLSIMECYAPNELSKFDLMAYKNGDLNKAYGR